MLCDGSNVHHAYDNDDIRYLTSILQYFIVPRLTYLLFTSVYIYRGEWVVNQKTLTDFYLALYNMYIMYELTSILSIIVGFMISPIDFSYEVGSFNEHLGNALSHLYLVYSLEILHASLLHRSSIIFSTLRFLGR